MTKPIMECGCAANGTLRQMDGIVFDPPIPICAVHDCTIIMTPPDLTGRTAKCNDHGEVPSSLDLPFFQHRPEWPHDRYYCGCRGWN